MIDHVIKVGLAVGFLTYLLTQSSVAPRWWTRFQNWWPLWDGKPFRCMICMSFWLSLVFLLHSYGWGVYTAIFRPCTAPMCLEGGAERYWFEVIYNTQGLIVATFATACISVLVCYIIDKLSMTILTFPKKDGE